jgi:amino acid adenylation domain-containing protein
MLVQHFLETSAGRYPDKVALVCGERGLTYSEIEAQANRLAHALRDAGVQRGDRVTILLENSAEAVVAIFAALKADAVFMVLHPGTKPDRLAYLLDDAEPAALVTDSAHIREAAVTIGEAHSLRCLICVDGAEACPTVRDTQHLAVIEWADLKRYPAHRPATRTISMDLATLIYTSGSTGQPKGVMSTHLNVVSATSSINGYLHNTPEDIIIDLLPLAFDYGLYQIMLAFQVGARLVLEKGFAFPAHTVAVIEREKVTGLPGVPTLFALLLKYPDLLRRGLPSLRYITNTAAALPVSHIEQIRAAFPHVTLFSMYGLTECKRVSYLPPEQLDHRPASVGIAIPDTEVYVVDDEGRHLPPGEVGELVVRGAHVTRGYWRAPALTAQRFRPGPLPGETVLYTGDLFKTDQEGFLYFVARKDDIIKSRGEKVSPREVENVVCRMAGVAEAAVVGVPDPVLGQAVKLFVVPFAGAQLTERVVRAYCTRNLVDYMVPKYVEVVTELPRTGNGKVDKKLLAASGA